MRPGDRYDRRAAYELLTTLEARFRGDTFHDISPDIHGVGWPLLWNEHVIPRMLETRRIDRDEATALQAIRHHRRTRPSDEDEATWADIYELLLCHYPGQMMSIANERVYRGQADDWPLVPTLFRHDPSSEELERRLDRTFAFVEALCDAERDLRARGESTDGDAFLELVAVAQHYGFPTHLLDFTRDIRVAAYFACTGATAGGTGSILILHLPQYQRLEGIDGSPYGASVTASAPNPRIAKQHGMFIAGHDALVWSDPRTDLLERYRFRHAGPFSPVGGFDERTLLDASTDDPLADLAARCGNAPRHPSAALAASFERFRAYAHALASRRFERMGAREYARTCAYALKPALAPDAPWIDRRIAQLFLAIQADVGQRDDLREWFKFPELARHAFEAYLAAPGELETRAAAGMLLYTRRANAAEQPIVDEIIDRHVDALVADLDGDRA